MYHIITELPIRKTLFVTPSLTIAKDKLNKYINLGFDAKIVKK